MTDVYLGDIVEILDHFSVHDKYYGDPWVLDCVFMHEMIKWNTTQDRHNDSCFISLILAPICLSSIKFIFSPSRTQRDLIVNRNHYIFSINQSWRMDFVTDSIFDLSNFSLICANLFWYSYSKFNFELTVSEYRSYFWWHTLIIRRFIFNISSVRFISIKFPWTSRHIITKSSLLLRMSITFQCDFRRVVTLRVFRTEVYLRLERSPCRCNLRTEVTSFTEMIILDFVCDIILSKKRHLDNVSNYCHSVLFFREFVIIREFFFIGVPPKKSEWMHER